MPERLDFGPLVGLCWASVVGGLGLPDDRLLSVTWCPSMATPYRLGIV
jgi:hypothetical protein